MNKTEFIKAVAEDAEITQARSQRVVSSVLDTITRTLANGDSVVFTGFGSFTVKDRAARAGRDPSTGKSMQIAAKKQPKFSAGKALKDAVNV